MSHLGNAFILYITHPIKIIYVTALSEQRVRRRGLLATHSNEFHARQVPNQSTPIERRGFVRLLFFAIQAAYQERPRVGLLPRERLLRAVRDVDVGRSLAIRAAITPATLQTGWKVVVCVARPTGTGGGEQR